jgi:hypothetical protein
MKRKEMLDIMAWRIHDINRYGCNPMDVAFELLDEMEAAGVLPPATGKLVTNYADMGTMPEHAWEPEDG